jgi:hypothetical protein
MWLCFSSFCLSRFWAFRNKVSKKNAIKKIAGSFSQPPKKVLTYLRHFSFLFPTPPLGPGLIRVHVAIATRAGQADVS